MIRLIIGTMGISLIVSYLMWVQIRVYRLRQDIYDIRDQLFDTANLLDCFDDEAYKSARGYLNALTSLAPHLSVALLAHVIASNKTTAHNPNSKNAKMQEEIDIAIRWAARRLFQYLSNETASGWLLRIAIIPILSMSEYNDRVNNMGQDATEKFIRSGVPVWSGGFKHYQALQ